MNLKTKNGNYGDKVTFEQIVELYLFNANFRQIIFPKIEKIEINVRCRIANYFAEQYGVLLCLKHLLKSDSHWKLFVQEVELLFEKYEQVDIKTMGFPENWKELLEG